MSKITLKRRLPIAILCALAGLAAPACALETGTGAEDGVIDDSVDVAEATLLEIKVDDATVSFAELGPGGLVLLSRLPSVASKNPLADPAVRELNPLQMYEYWTHEPAPEVLRAAYERSVALERELLAAGAEPEPEAELLEEPEDEPLVDKLLEEEFRFWYCGDANRCLIYVTGDRQYETFGKGIAGTVNPIYGNVRIHLRWRRAWGWENIPGWHVVVAQDEVVTYGAGLGVAIGRQFRATVHDAQYDIYNWAHSWW